MDAVEVDGDYNATIDYPRLRVASGIQITPKVTATYVAGDGQYDFTVEAQDEEEGFALTDDKVYAVLYESVLKRTRLGQGVCRALRVGAEAHALGGFGDTGRA